MQNCQNYKNANQNAKQDVYKFFLFCCLLDLDSY